MILSSKSTSAVLVIATFKKINLNKKKKRLTYSYFDRKWQNDQWKIRNFCYRIVKLVASFLICFLCFTVYFIFICLKNGFLHAWLHFWRVWCGRSNLKWTVKSCICPLAVFQHQWSKCTCSNAITITGNQLAIELLIARIVQFSTAAVTGWMFPVLQTNKNWKF